ncbi:excisionase family DNA binding protein [Saccharothrix coeruleofusca]|uniref:excisionase family DNA-binding protein n=1 Tax=Saccharothrix coeruleofusca TaxID=33919 RepID=UPI001AE933FC|nr:excisionase family DNA-binding protein [Saccharothrix coeruleofusca]MBP2341096.1 excisionase family DNA binding protein [Saccharothrix coeruleofusca]
MGNHTEETEELVLVGEFAKELDVHPSTVYRAISDGRLPALRIGNGRGTLRLQRTDCDEYRKACQQAAHRLEPLTHRP